MGQVFQGGLVEGEAVLVRGKSADVNLLMGLSFLASGLTAEPSREVLMISLKQDHSGILRMLERYEQVAGSMLVKSGQRPALNPRVRLLHTPPDYFSASSFYDWVSRALHDSRAGFARVAFNSIDQLGSNSPLFSREPLFVPGLIELFRSKGITPLFLAAGNVDEQVESSFDRFITATPETESREPDVPGGRGAEPSLAPRRNQLWVLETADGGKAWITLKAGSEG